MTGSKNEEKNESEHDQKSCYNIISVSRTPEISPNGTIEIELYYTGFGYPDKGKIYLNFGGINPDNEGKIVSSMRIGETNDGSKVVATGEDYLHENEFPDDEISGFVHLMEPSHFAPAKIPDSTTIEDVIAPNMGENKHSGHPPLVVHIPCSGLTPGDYKITATLTYADGEKVENSTDFVEVYVQNWVERNQFELRLIAVVLGLTGLLFAIASFGIDVLTYLNIG
ncbi:hypothetical protein [Natrialba chahannaoensis]|uniref:hypothetical protein n=1 Tax=Natrialba chahannaoensis TaxID=68911 RepID=UPI0012691322|nr:hypothetical protein [Natrialba chahannaoensis]